MEKQVKESILLEAERLTNGARQSDYGHPIDNFNRIMAMAKPILESDIDPALKFSLLMVQVKIGRLLNTPDHRDSVIDGAGYFNTYSMVLDRMNKNEA